MGRHREESTCVRALSLEGRRETVTPQEEGVSTEEEAGVSEYVFDVLH
jgi:hypothetical protein